MKTTLNVDIPVSVNRTRTQVRRKRRSRPAAERFHDLYEATGEILGEGSQGAVHCYKSKRTGNEFAVKIIPKTVDYDRSKILKEIDLFHHCQGHKNILQLNEFYEENERFYLVFDRVNGGNLFTQIQQRGHLTERECRDIIRDLAEAIAFLHHKGIAHRDLKPENILCASESSLTPVRICDFDLGSAIVIKQESPVTTPELLTPVGSLEYMAPEVVDAWVGDAFSYDKKCDIWSLGIMLYIMLCGYPPFTVACGQDCLWNQGGSCKTCQDMLFEKIQDGSYEFHEQYWSEISESAKDLVRHLLVRDPHFRYTADEILRHTWFSESVPATSLATPGVLSRNNSSTYLQQQMSDTTRAFNRIMLAKISQTASLSSLTSVGSNPFFSSSLSGDDSPKFMVGEFSDEEEDDDEVVHIEVKAAPHHSITLHLPSSKLAQRRVTRLI